MPAGKETAYDTDIRVPLIVRGPRCAGRRDEQLHGRQHRSRADVRPARGGHDARVSSTGARSRRSCTIRRVDSQRAALVSPRALARVALRELRIGAGAERTARSRPRSRRRVEGVRRRSTSRRRARLHPRVTTAFAPSTTCTWSTRRRATSSTRSTAIPTSCTTSPRNGTYAPLVARLHRLVDKLTTCQGAHVSRPRGRAGLTAARLVARHNDACSKSCSLHRRSPSNTGSIIRLCANVGARLHLVRPLGFALDDAALRRAGLDYHELTDTQVWDTWEDCRAGLGRERRWFATTTHVPHRRYDDVDYRAGDAVVFGCEATGLGDRAARGVFGRSPSLHSDAPVEPQPQSVERGECRCVRSLAPARFRRRGDGHVRRVAAPGVRRAGRRSVGIRSRCAADRPGARRGRRRAPA